MNFNSPARLCVSLRSLRLCVTISPAATASFRLGWIHAVRSWQKNRGDATDAELKAKEFQPNCSPFGDSVAVAREAACSALVASRRLFASPAQLIGYGLETWRRGNPQAAGLDWLEVRRRITKPEASLIS